MTDQERAGYHEHTSRLNLPVRPVREAWVPVGRRGGKSQIAALVAVYKAFYERYRLAKGERGTLAVIAADRRQAQVVFGYIVGLADSTPALRRMVTRRTRDTLELATGVTVAVHTSSFRSSRGVLRVISTPYARQGSVWAAYKDHFKKELDPVLVWTGSSLSMNPGLPEEDIRQAYEANPQAASAEYGGEFRSDIDAFISEGMLRCDDHRKCSSSLTGFDLDM